MCLSLVVLRVGLCFVGWVFVGVFLVFLVCGVLNVRKLKSMR
jgi:hypothetical protein